MTDAQLRSKVDAAIGAIAEVNMPMYQLLRTLKVKFDSRISGFGINHAFNGITFNPEWLADVPVSELSSLIQDITYQILKRASEGGK